MQLKNPPNVGAFLPRWSETEYQLEIGLWNITSRFFGPLDQTDRVLPKVLTEPCILKLFRFTESIKIKVIQVYARNHVNFNQRVGRAFHGAGMTERTQYRAYQRRFPRPQIAIQPDHHPGMQVRRQLLPERGGCRLVGNRQRQG